MTSTVAPEIHRHSTTSRLWDFGTRCLVITTLALSIIAILTSLLVISHYKLGIPLGPLSGIGAMGVNTAYAFLAVGTIVAILDIIAIVTQYNRHKTFELESEKIAPKVSLMAQNLESNEASLIDQSPFFIVVQRRDVQHFFNRDAALEYYKALPSSVRRKDIREHPSNLENYLRSIAEPILSVFPCQDNTELRLHFAIGKYPFYLATTKEKTLFFKENPSSSTSKPHPEQAKIQKELDSLQTEAKRAPIEVGTYRIIESPRFFLVYAMQADGPRGYYFADRVAAEKCEKASGLPRVDPTQYTQDEIEETYKPIIQHLCSNLFENSNTVVYLTFDKFQYVQVGARTYFFKDQASALRQLEIEKARNIPDHPQVETFHQLQKQINAQIPRMPDSSYMVAKHEKYACIFVKEDEENTTYTYYNMITEYQQLDNHCKLLTNFTKWN